MSKIRELNDFLQTIQKDVSEKLEKQEETLEKEINKNSSNLSDLKESLEHTKGQLYETNYITDNFWKIISK